MTKETLPYDLVPPWVNPPPESSSIIEKLQTIIDQVLPGYLAVKITELKEKEIHGSCPYLRKTANAFGFMHGGTIFILGDTLAGCLLWAGNDGITYEVTINSSIKYIRPVNDGEIKCIVREKSRKDKKIYLQADFWSPQGKKIARMKIEYYKVLKEK